MIPELGHFLLWLALGVSAVLGTMPLLVLAGLIEGFITPSDLPIPAKLAVAGVSGLLLVSYLLRGRPR